MDIKLISNNIKFKYRVSCIIVNNNRILFTKYGDKYCLPGGYAEVGETSVEAVKREIYEETELNLDDIKYLGMIENFFTNIKGEYTHGIDIYYKTNIENKDANKIDMNRDENDKGTIVNHHFIWIDIDQLDSYDIVPNKIIDVIKNNELDFHYIIKE